MKLALSSFVFISLSAAVYAQGRGSTTIGGIQLSAPQNFVVAARTLQLTAVPRNDRGASMRDRSIDWQTSDSSRATIGRGGLINAISPGRVKVTATDVGSGVSASLDVYVYPARIVIAPQRLSIQAGESGTLRARALDANGAELAGVSFQWATDLPAIATVSDGSVTGVGEGQATVTASIDMGEGAERFTASASVDVARRSEFRLQRLLTSDTMTNSATILTPYRVSVAGDNVAGIANMSNGGQALLLSRGGQRPRALASAGVPLPGIERLPMRYTETSVNSRGDVLALAEFPTEWCGQIFVLFRAASNWAPSLMHETTNCSLNMGATSLNDQGDYVYRNGNVLLKRLSNGTDVRIIAIGDQPSGADRITNINNWSYSRFGNVLVEISGAAGTTQYLIWDGTTTKKLFAVGDTVDGKTAQWARLPVEVSPGAFVTRIGGSNWASISRLSVGAWTVIAINGKDNLGWIHDNFDASASTAYFNADMAGKTGLFRASGGSVQQVVSFPSYREMGQPFVIGAADVISFGLMDRAAVHAIRYTGTTSAVVFGPGVSCEGQVGIGIRSQSVPQGINPSNIIIRTAGDSLVKVSPSGSSVLIQPGARGTGETLSSINMFAANRLGDVAFSVQNGQYRAGLYVYRNGQIQNIGRVEDRLENTTIQWFPQGDDQLAIGNSGHVAAHTGTANGSFIALYTTSAATARRIVQINTPVTGGGSIQWARIAVDDNGRVGILGSMSTGRWAFFIWDNGILQRVLDVGQQDGLGRNILDFSAIRAAGSKFYLRYNAAGAGQAIMAVDGSSKQVIVTDGFTGQSGTQVSNVLGTHFSANSRGDVVFSALTPSGVALFLKRPDTDTVVAPGRYPTPDGDWLLDIYGAGTGSTGEFVFPALTWQNGKQRMAIYLATPR